MIGLTGPSGAGKTYSALQLAYGITGDWSKIVVADTENKSALYYAGKMTGNWEHIPFDSSISQGYHPNNWIKLIDIAESDPNTEVLVLDSISHEWQACLQLIEQFAKTGAGNTYVQWGKVTPLHNAFIDKMRNSRLHIIATMRSVTEYVLELNEKGKQAPKKVGMKSKQREDLDYEFGIIFDIDISHYAVSNKDRTGIFVDRAPFKISADLGKELVAWAKDGHYKEEVKVPVFDINDPLLVQGVRAALVKQGKDRLLEMVMKTLHMKPKSKEAIQEAILKAEKDDIMLEHPGEAL